MTFEKLGFDVFIGYKTIYIIEAVLLVCEPRGFCTLNMTLPLKFPAWFIKNLHNYCPNNSIQNYKFSNKFVIRNASCIRPIVCKWWGITGPNPIRKMHTIVHSRKIWCTLGEFHQLESQIIFPNSSGNLQIHNIFTMVLQNEYESLIWGTLVWMLAASEGSSLIKPTLKDSTVVAGGCHFNNQFQKFRRCLGCFSPYM